MKKWICRVCYQKYKDGEILRCIEFYTIRGIARHICSEHFDLWKIAIKLSRYKNEKKQIAESSTRI